MAISKRRVLFHRSWSKFNGGTSGGQLKVRDAFEHVMQSPDFEPHIYFGPETVWFDNPGNLWLPYRHLGESVWEIQPSDILFFAGLDWLVLPPAQRKNPPVPIINIAQPRHVSATDRRNAFLKHPAIRIAKSQIGKKILEEYGVNGPVFFIPDAIDMDLLPKPNPNPDLDILVVGLKNQPMAEALERRLRSVTDHNGKPLKIAIQVPPKLPTRDDFLNLVNRAKTVAYLPLEAELGSEGFYLPALEGMAMGKLVVCPYAIGNSDFCIPDVTCLQPEYTEDAIFQSIVNALALSISDRTNIIQQALIMSKNHTIEQERIAILELLDRADSLWADKKLFHDQS